MSNLNRRLYIWTGLALVLSGCQIFLLFPAGLPFLPDLVPGGNDVPFYLAATIGCAFVAWGWILAAGSRLAGAETLLGLPTAIAFFMMSAMRLFAFGGSPQIRAVAGGLALGEAILFAVVGSLFLVSAYDEVLAQAGERPGGFGQRLHQVVTSAKQLPTWVLIWVMLVLSPVNLAALLMTDTLIGQWTALALLFVLASNTTLLLVQARLSALMAIPHLVVWVPLLAYVGARMGSGAALDDGECVLGIAVLLINGLSVAFDGLDTWKWFRGEQVFLWPAEANTD